MNPFEEIGRRSNPGEPTQGFEIGAQRSAFRGAPLAGCEMRLDRGALAVVEPALGIFGKEMPDLDTVHAITPFNRSRSACLARASLDLTVPRR